MQKRKVLLFIFEGFCEFEITVAISMLRTTHDLFTVALERKTYKSESGLSVIPDFTVDDMDESALNEYEIMMIPGGDLQPVADRKDLFEWILTCKKRIKVLAAICSGVYLFAKAGVLDGIPYTVTLTKAQRDFLGGFDEQYYTYQPVVVSEHIVTAQGHAYVDFGIRLYQMVNHDIDPSTVAFYKGEGNVYME